MRLLEIEILRLIHRADQPNLDIQQLSLVDVDAFYGIEISEWPARIAEVAMWLMDHQMNIRLSEAFGQYFVRLPLKKAPTIVCQNALRLDWKTVLSPERCNYVLGNPPFVGKQFATDEQKADMEIVCGNVKGGGVLDYVTGWYFKAGEYIQGTSIAVGFVSTNSISQGEQVGILWNELFKRYRLKILFAHRTFAWESEARGKAHVHVVVIGFGAFDSATKRIYDYEADADQASVTTVKNISPYLVEGNDVVVLSRSKPLSNVPEIAFGSMPNDGGHLLLSDSERDELLEKEPGAEKFIRPFLGSVEFINGASRWCLWLIDATPAELRRLPEVLLRIEAVKKDRLESKRSTTRELAKTPALFGEIRQPSKTYLAIPKTSSERRVYIPMAFLDSDVIASTELFTMDAATPFHFGILASVMHMAWVRQVCGRLKSDLRYSASLGYNNYPWPESPSTRQRGAVENAAKTVLAARTTFANSTLADLYDPLTMPPVLVEAHSDLDRAVDLCYRPQTFQNDRQRVEFLFALYEKLTAPLIAPGKKTRRKKQQ